MKPSNLPLKCRRHLEHWASVSWWRCLSPTAGWCLRRWSGRSGQRHELRWNESGFRVLSSTRLAPLCLSAKNTRMEYSGMRVDVGESSWKWPVGRGPLYSKPCTAQMFTGFRDSVHHQKYNTTFGHNVDYSFPFLGDCFTSFKENFNTQGDFEKILTWKTETSHLIRLLYRYWMHANASSQNTITE